MSSSRSGAVPERRHQHLVGDGLDQLRLPRAHDDADAAAVGNGGALLSAQLLRESDFGGVDMGHRHPAERAVVLDEVDGRPVRHARNGQSRHPGQRLVVVERRPQRGGRLVEKTLRLLGALSILDVAEDAEVKAGRDVGDGPEFGPANGAVTAQKRPFSRHHPHRPELAHLVGGRPVARRHEVGGGSADHLLARTAEEPTSGRVGIDDLQVVVHQDDAVDGVLIHGAKPVFELTLPLRAQAAVADRHHENGSARDARAPKRPSGRHFAAVAAETRDLHGGEIVDGHLRRRVRLSEPGGNDDVRQPRDELAAAIPEELLAGGVRGHDRAQRREGDQRLRFAVENVGETLGRRGDPSDHLLQNVFELGPRDSRGVRRHA